MDRDIPKQSEVKPTVADLQSDHKPQKTSGKQGSEGSASVHFQFDSDLRLLIDAWPSLPAHLKRAMLAMLG
jgi:hypothetical protein